MFAAALFAFAFLVGAVAVRHTADAFGRGAGVGCAGALLAIAWAAPLGNLLALLIATAALGVARAEARRQLGG